MHNGINVAAFTHSVKTRANSVNFAHQSLCNPKISTLLKVNRKGFLKGCSNISKELICKYLNPSPATAKGHMKRPRHGIKSTTPKANNTGAIILIQAPEVIPIQLYAEPREIPIQEFMNPQHRPGPTLIANNHNKSIANIFCFGEFADKNTRIVYQDMTGNFPFMSLDSNVCYFLLHHVPLQVQQYPCNSNRQFGRQNNLCGV